MDVGYVQSQYAKVNRNNPTVNSALAINSTLKDEEVMLYLQMGFGAVQVALRHTLRVLTWLIDHHRDFA